jgi:hypothetical protein
LTRKTANIIGNGKLENALSGVVDDAQFVMRFNKPNLPDDVSGSRTDMLMLVASSNALHRRMIDPDFLQNAALKSAQVLMLAYPPEVWEADGRIGPCRRLISWGMLARKSVSSRRDFMRTACGARYCGPRMRKVFPSIGFLDICYVLANFPASEWDIKLCSSNWQGWKRHDWQNERAWVEEKIARGHIALVA